jgi:hypothetical protein
LLAPAGEVGVGEHPLGSADGPCPGCELSAGGCGSR